MAATSPYTGNDYQAVSNFRPYELPINDIFKGISAQNQFWDAGAARVKSYHDNALNLKLSLEPNKEIRRKFLEDAEKQLVKLSSMDLSDPSVQRKGISIFKPLFRDEGIMYDDLATRHFEKVRNDAINFRNKDNGKFYSDINFKYAMDGYEEFISSQDRMAGKSAFQKRKEYTPYYDYTEDFSKVLKDCKPSSMETQSPYYGSSGNMSGYTKEEYLKTLTAAQARGCLEAGLSSNALRQLQIEGAVSYKGRPDVLASDTRMYLNGVSSNLSNQLQELAAQKIKLEEDKSLTKEQLEAAKNQLDLEMKSIGDELLKTNISSEKLRNGDYTDMLNNFETYAGSVYSYRKLYKKALASAYEEKRSLYKADPVQLNAIRFEQDKYLAQMEHTFDISMENLRTENDVKLKMMDIMYGGSKSKDGVGSGSDIIRDPMTGEITINSDIFRKSSSSLTMDDKPSPDDKIYEKLQQQITDLKTLDQQNNLGLYNSLIDRGDRDPNFAKTFMAGFNYTGTWDQFKVASKNNRFAKNGENVGIEQTGWFKAYSKLNPKDEDLYMWQRQNATVNTGLSVLNRKIELAEKQVEKELGINVSQSVTEALKEIKPIKLSDGTTITAKEMHDAINGVNPKITLAKYPNKEEIKFIVNGKEISYGKYYRDENSDGATLEKLFDNVAKKSSSVSNKINQKRIQVYNSLGFDKEPWFSTSEGEKNPIVKMIKTQFMGSDATGTPKERDNIKILWQDFAGGIQVSIPGIKKGDAEKLLKLGIGTSVEIEDGIATIRGTNFNIIPQAINNPTLKNAAYQLATIAETRAYTTTGPKAKVDGATITIPIYISGEQKLLDIDIYKGTVGPEFRGYIKGATDKRPIVIASDPYQLFEAIEAARIKVNQ